MHRAHGDRPRNLVTDHLAASFVIITGPQTDEL